MGSINLADILVTPLLRIDTSGGEVMHAMRQDDLGYVGFGEAYVSCIDRGAIKGWKNHTQMTMNLIVLTGMVKFVFCAPNNRGSYDFRTEEVGDSRYMRITVPPGIWFGFQGVGEKVQSMVLNLASIPHDVNEVMRLDVASINYKWSN